MTKLFIERGGKLVSEGNRFGGDTSGRDRGWSRHNRDCIAQREADIAFREELRHVVPVIPGAAVLDCDFDPERPSVPLCRYTGQPLPAGGGVVRMRDGNVSVTVVYSPGGAIIAASARS